MAGPRSVEVELGARCTNAGARRAGSLGRGRRGARGGAPAVRLSAMDHGPRRRPGPVDRRGHRRPRPRRATRRDPARRARGRLGPVRGWPACFSSTMADGSIALPGLEPRHRRDGGLVLGARLERGLSRPDRLRKEAGRSRASSDQSRGVPWRALLAPTTAPPGASRPRASRPARAGAARRSRSSGSRASGRS